MADDETGGAARGRSRWAAPLIAGLIAAVTAFAIVVALDDDDPQPTGGSATEPATTPTGRAVFARMSCGGCHTLSAAGSKGQFAPNLDERLPNHTAASLKAKITDPYPGRSPGDTEFVGGMPEDFADRMTDQELDALVAFLLSSRRPPATTG
jgi:mono/diheme cytochrome c family protein